MKVETYRGERGQTLAMVLKRSDEPPGVRFVTPEHFPLQVGQLSHKVGRVIDPHRHKPNPYSPGPSPSVMEVLVVLKGALKVTLYDVMETQTLVVTEGDTLILVSGGHGFEVLSDCQIIEVKEGPYTPESKVYLQGL